MSEPVPPIPEDRAPSVFLSYARDDDEPFVRRLYEDLTREGFRVWFDRESMPSRALTFHQEIRDAIDDCARLILVIGPKAVTSDYVTQEWQFAYLAVNKAVNPVVRLDGRKPDGTPVDGFELIPEELKLHAEDFRDDSRYSESLKKLVRQLREPLPPVGKLVAVPELPPTYRAQPERLKALRDILLIDLRRPVDATGASARIALGGMPGIGKSVLANALVHHPQVRKEFPDNIYWIRLGQEPRIEDLQRWLARELGGEGRFEDRHSGKEELRRLLAERKSLLILDDVWEREHAESFNAIGPLGRILLTTRDTGLITALAAKETHYRVELPTLAEAEGLLAAAAEVDPESLSAEAREVIERCGRLPLAITLCGSMAHDGASWRDILEALENHDLEFLSADHPSEEQHRNAWIAMDVSLRRLSPGEQERFAELSVFSPDATVPRASVATLWERTGGIAQYQAGKLLAKLARRSLVQLSRVEDVGQGEVGASLHDLLHIFAEGMAIKRFGSRHALHQRLLDAYGARCANGWPSGPDDGYFFQNLVHHLLSAERIDDAVELVTDLPWLESKCRAGLVFGLQTDCQDVIAVLPEAQAELEEERRRDARLARWTTELIEYSRQWTSGEGTPELPEIPPTVRMWTDEEIETENRRIIEEPTRLDRLRAFSSFVESECYPLLEHGDRPGFVVQHAFNSAPAGPVHAAADRRLPGLGVPLLLRRWPDSAVYNPRPALVRTLKCDSGSVRDVSMTPDGRLAVSASQEIRVWDLNTGSCVRTLKHQGVWRVCMTPDGRLVVAGSREEGVVVWDLETESRMQAMAHPGVTDVDVTPDGRLVVSAGNDGKLRVWDIESNCLRTFDCAAEMRCLTVTPDGRLAFSAEAERIQVQDLKSGARLEPLGFHSDEVTSTDVTPDARLAVSTAHQELRTWDFEKGISGRPLLGHDDSIWAVSVAPDGRLAASGSNDRTLRVWDLERGICLRTARGHTDWVGSVGMTPDGRRGITASRDGTVRVWDLLRGGCARNVQNHSDSVRAISVTRDGCRAVSGGMDETLRVWDLERGVCLRSMAHHRGWVLAVDVTPDGRRGVSAGMDESLCVWDLDSGACVRRLGHGVGVVNSIAITPGGQRAITADDNAIRVWDLETTRCLQSIELHGLRSASVMHDGRRALSASRDDGIKVWDLESGRCLRTFGDRNTTGMSVASNGSRVVSVRPDELRVWDIEAGDCLGTLQHRGVKIVSVSEDGMYAVSASRNDDIRLWDLRGGICLSVCASVASCITTTSCLSVIVFGTSTGEIHQLRAIGVAGA